MTQTTFAGLGLPARLVATLEKNGFATPKPIQERAIPCQLDGRDILGIAQTGSGKTAAFALPIIVALGADAKRAEPKCARALVLAPTRELAVQIEQAFRSFSAGTGLTTALVLGGVSRQTQINRLARGVDVLIATPGRLTDLVAARAVRLDTVRYLVLDEADRMLDMGFIRDVRKLAKATHPQRRTALFSATMAPEIAELAAGLLADPVRVDVAPQGTTVEEIRQEVVPTPSGEKRYRLSALLAERGMERVLVFTRTKRSADRVAKNLSGDGFQVAALHGNKSQNARQAALNGFRDGKVRVLVATDIAARGIDVPNISHVINYELPDEPDSYVHRIGRTGRNGAAGTALTLLDAGERAKLKAIEKLIRKTLPVAAVGAVEIRTRPAEARPAATERAWNPVPAGTGRGNRRPRADEAADAPWAGLPGSTKGPLRKPRWSAKRRRAQRPTAAA